VSGPFSDPAYPVYTAPLRLTDSALRTGEMAAQTATGYDESRPHHSSSAGTPKAINALFTPTKQRLRIPPVK